MENRLRLGQDQDLEEQELGLVAASCRRIVEKVVVKVVAGVVDLQWARTCPRQEKSSRRLMEEEIQYLRVLNGGVAAAGARTEVSALNLLDFLSCLVLVHNAVAVIWAVLRDSVSEAVVQLEMQQPAPSSSQHPPPTKPHAGYSPTQAHHA